MTEDHWETQDMEIDALDEELAEGLEETESAEQIEQADQTETEEPFEESEDKELQEQEEREDASEPNDQYENSEQAEPETDGENEPDHRDDSSQQDKDVEPTVESVVEAVLFASDEPLSAARLANIVETDTKQVRQQIKNLNKKYRANNNAFKIEQIAGGFQMLTLSPYNHWLKKLLRARSDSKLSTAAMETLAIIAYKQPIIRADIEAIRGVATGEVIRSLTYKGLVKIVGRAEVLGRPMLYGTTKKFLEVFGLNSLKDLPKVEELKKPPA